ncbi:MAG: hypothetical protein OCC45_06330 [Desulfotalea sp.]
MTLEQGTKLIELNQEIISYLSHLDVLGMSIIGLLLALICIGGFSQWR